MPGLFIKPLGQPTTGMRCRSLRQAPLIEPTAESLLTDRITQPFAVFVIIFAADPRASLRKPPSTHRVFQGATLTINRPHSVVENGETAEAATATAASVRQSRAARRAPVEHLHFEIMAVPVIGRHTDCYSTFDAVDLLVPPVTARWKTCALSRLSTTVQARSGFGSRSARCCSEG